MEAGTPSCGMPGAAGCRRLLAGGGGAGPPGAAGSSDVAAGRVTLPALCSYQCETGLGRRLSVPLPAGSGGCAGAPGAQGRGREGGEGAGVPAPPRPGAAAAGHAIPVQILSQCHPLHPAGMQADRQEGSVKIRVYLYYMYTFLYIYISVCV